MPPKTSIKFKEGEIMLGQARPIAPFPDDIETEYSFSNPPSFTTTIPLDGMTFSAVLNGRSAGLILGQVLQKLIDRVIFNDPATIIKWKDGTKTIVKCRQGDTYNREVGFMMCIIKYLCGNQSNATKKFISKYCGKNEKSDSINNADNDEIDYEQEERRLTQDCHITCANCRLSKYRNGTTLSCKDFYNDRYDEYKQIIRKWAKDCPAKKEGTD